MIYGICELAIGDFFVASGYFMFIYRNRNPGTVWLLLCSFVDEGQEIAPPMLDIRDREYISHVVAGLEIQYSV